MEERLQKIIANRGFCSRRRAEFLIKNGRVRVNSRVVTLLGTKVDENTKISIDNKELPLPSAKVYVMFNKPESVICANYDPANRPIILDYFTDLKERVYSIGRLDYDTSGLLILTNDGDFANHVMHPRYQIHKTYHLIIKDRLTDDHKYKLEKGIWIESNFKTSQSSVRNVEYRENTKTTHLNLTIREGRNHQIKKMMISLNLKLLKLSRFKIGDLVLDSHLKAGAYRHLTKHEIKKLQQYF